MTVAIAGAGLSGLMAARTASKAGEDVVVYEMKSRLLPTAGPHTEALRNYGSVDAVEELRGYGFTVPPFAEVQRTVRKSENFENVLRGKSYYLFMRGREGHSVDQKLYRECLDLGVQFRFGTRAPEDVDIVATGPPPGRFNMLGAGYTFSADGASLDPESVIALLDNTVAPGGYLVITPGIGHHSIYSVSWTDLDYTRVLSMAEKAFERPWIREILGSSKFVDKIYGRAYYEPDPIAMAVRGGTFFAGEAGGFQDAVAGYGFRLAVITGALAGRAALGEVDYPVALGNVFGDEFEKAHAYRKRLDHATNRDFDKLVQALGPELTLDEYRKLRESLRGL